MGDNLCRNWDILLENYATLAEYCLFILRVEIRCHCLYYLDLVLREVCFIIDVATKSRW